MCWSRRSLLALALTLALLAHGCTPSPFAARRAATLTALARMSEWLEQARPTAGTAFGFECLDAWTWAMLAAWHPDARVRTSAGTTTDARLRALAAPPEWTAVTLSYWALALRLMAHRGLPLEAHLAALAEVDIAGALATTSPTTRWWTVTLLHQVGAAVQPPDPADTFIAGLASRPRGQTIVLSEVYTLYHEIAPAMGVGLTPMSMLDPVQVERARAFAIESMRFAAPLGDTDALAEALVTGALLDLRDTAAYRDGLAILLERQNPDGTFRSDRDSRRSSEIDHYRHVMVVAAFALLTSLVEYHPDLG